SSLFLTRPAAAALFTLSLHDALPISLPSTARSDRASGWSSGTRRMVDAGGGAVDRRTDGRGSSGRGTPGRRAAQRASAVSGPVELVIGEPPRPAAELGDPGPGAYATGPGRGGRPEAGGGGLSGGATRSSAARRAAAERPGSGARAGDAARS